MSNQGYIPKDLTFDSKGRQKLIEGITKISKAGDRDWETFFAL